MRRRSNLCLNNTPKNLKTKSAHQSSLSMTSVKKRQLDDEDQYSGFSSSYKVEDSDFEKESFAILE